MKNYATTLAGHPSPRHTYMIGHVGKCSTSQMHNEKPTNPNERMQVNTHPSRLTYP